MAITISTATTHGPRITYNEYVPATTHKICSVFPGEVYFHNPNGDYTVPGCKEDERYSFVEINAAYEKYDLGEDRHIVSRSITSKQAAEDFIGIPAGNKEYLDRGLFVPAGELPTDAEIAAANNRLKLWLEKQVESADREYGMRGQTRFVDTNARLALKKLGLNRPWGDSYTPEETQVCPACKSPMRKGALIHSVNDRSGCGQKVAYNAANEPFWPDAPMLAKAPAKL